MSARIMVIDNNKNMRGLFTSILIHAGWEVFSEAYASIDLAAVHHFNPDLIILDFNLQQDGADWGFLQLLKMEDSTTAIPILVCTTVNSLSPEIAGYLAGRHIRVVHKPFTAMPFVVQEILTAATPPEVLPTYNPMLPILVVEDNEDLRETLKEILLMEGYRVVTAANGQLALNMVLLIQHRLIVLDINMPVMDGLEFIAAYARLPEPHSPVIVYSGTVHNLDPAALPPFVIATLNKPSNVDRMLTLIRQYLEPA